MKLPFKKLRRNRKGGASVAIAIVLAMIIVTSVVNNIIVWGQVLNAEDRDMLDEQIEIEHVYFVDGNLYIDVRNTGSVQAHLISLWLNDTRYELDDFLDVEEFKTLSVSDLDPPLDLEDVFTVKTCTYRGNTAITTYSPEPTPDVKEGGIFRVNWFYCKYTNQSQTTPVDAYIISIDERYVAFYLEVTNNWIYPCTIKEWSVLTLVIAHIEPVFFIAKGVNHGGTPSVEPYENLVIAPQESVVLTFGAMQPESNEFAWEYNSWGMNYPEGLRNLLGDEEGAGIQISIFFEMEIKGQTVMLGQTISTQALLLYDP